MSKFTKKVSTKVINRAGGQSYKQSDKLGFVSIMLTSFLNNQAYRTGDQTTQELVEFVRGLPDKKFAAKAALFARKEFGMRSVSHVVAGEIARTVKGETWTKSFFKNIVHRPDDMMEILGYLYSTGETTEPNSLKKGFAKALENMDAYQLSKYKYEGKSVSLVDVVNLVHPKGNDQLSALMKGTLQSPETWEVLLSACGADKEKKAQVWKRLICEKKLGYFALLRNLRNILEQAPDMVQKACEQLCDKEKIKKSLVLPFRFSTAIEQIEKLNCDGTRDVLIALNKALDLATENVPRMPGKTLVVLDCSGSMAGKPAEIGALFASILYKSNNADLMVFSDDAEYKTLNPLDSTLTLAKSIRFESGGTNFHSIFQTANKAYDRVIILSDMQGWIGHQTPQASFDAYRLRYKTHPYIYSFDLTGYGTMQFPTNRVACLAGFSDKIFDIMGMLENDPNALLNKIESYEL